MPIKQNYFHCYVTANDIWHYKADLKNLLRIKNCKHGLDKVNLLIAISQAKKLRFTDQLFKYLVKLLFINHKSVKLKTVFFKSNEGRDFSSYSACLNKILEKGIEDGFCFFQNRSGYGPFMENWYAKFIDQINKFPMAVLCGSTINFRDHPMRSTKINLPHVQTYAFLAKIKAIKSVLSDLKAISQSTRLDMILNGEIQLSQKILNNGNSITCMEWPDAEVTASSQAIERFDVRGKLKNKHQFYHKGLFHKKRSILDMLAESVQLVIVIFLNLIGFRVMPR